MNRTTKIIEVALKLEAEEGLPAAAAIVRACDEVAASASARRMATKLYAGARKRAMPVEVAR